MAEGTERHFSSKFKLFLPIVKGSSAELRPWLYLANGIKLLKRKETAEIAEETKSDVVNLFSTTQLSHFFHFQ